MKTKEKFIIGIIGLYTLTILFIIKQGTWSQVDEPGFLLEPGYWAGIQLLDMGRACLLHGLVPKIICIISDNNTRILYLYSSIIFVCIVYLVYKEFLKQKQTVSVIMVIFLILFLLSPGIVTIFSSALFEEKLLILYFLLFGIFLHQYYDDEKNDTKTQTILIILGLLINFSKEGGILSLFIIGIVMMLKNKIEKRDDKDNFIEKLFVSIPIITVLFWKLVILDYTTRVYGNPDITIVGYSKYVINATKYIVSDPIIFFICIPILLIRLFTIVKSKTLTVADIMAYGGLGTLGVIIITQTNHAGYYLTPIYATMIWFLFQEKQFFQKKFMRIVMGVTIVFMIKNIPDGINHFLSSRYERIIHTEIKKLVEYEQVFCEGLLSLTVLNNRYENPHVFSKGSFLVQSPSLDAHKLVRSKTDIISAVQPRVVLYEQEVPQIQQLVEFKTLFGFQPAERKLIYRVIQFI